MKNTTRTILAGLALSFVALTYSASSNAGTPDLQNLNATQLDTVIKNMGAGLAFRLMEPASSYGKIFGLQAGIGVNLTSISAIKDTIPNTGNASYLPSGDVYLGVSLPYGIGFEFGFLPIHNISSVKISRYAGDLKWTITDHFWKLLPASVAVHAGYGTSKFLFNETISGVSDTITFDSGVFQSQILIGEKLMFIEPYIGLGMITQSTTLSNSGTITLYDKSVSQTNSYNASASSFFFSGGIQMSLLIPTLTLEYDSLFGTHSYSAKFALKF